MKNLIAKESSFPGIYIITCLSNGKTYIGSSKCIYHRVKRHLSDLRKDQHGNPIVQNCFHKYGEDNFTTTIVEKITDVSTLIDREKFWIDSLKSTMNIRNPIKLEFTEDQKKQISKSLKFYFKDNPQKGKKFTVFDLEGNVEGKFKSWAEGAYYLNTKRHYLIRVCDKHLSHKGFIIRSGHIDKNPIPYKKGNRQLRQVPVCILPEHLINYKTNNKYITVQFNSSGEYLNTFKNPPEASRITTINLSKIRNSIALGHQGGKFYWKYLSELQIK